MSELYASPQKLAALEADLADFEKNFEAADCAAPGSIGPEQRESAFAAFSLGFYAGWDRRVKWARKLKGDASTLAGTPALQRLAAIVGFQGMLAGREEPEFRAMAELLHGFADRAAAALALGDGRELARCDLAAAMLLRVLRDGVPLAGRETLQTSAEMLLTELSMRAQAVPPGQVPA